MPADCVSYGVWNLPYGELGYVLDEEEARRRDAAGEEYWVIFGDPAHPEKVLQVAPEKVHYKVVWLDDLNRITLLYLFVPEDDNHHEGRAQRLFLEQLHYKEFDPGDREPPPHIDSAAAGTSYFEHDGSAYHTTVNGQEHYEGHSDPMEPDQATHILFEPAYPVFGEWDRITRKDRDQ